MARPVAAFDVDGTLIDKNDKPRKDVIAMLKAMSAFCDIVVWSGGGQQYAEMWGRRLNLPSYVSYGSKLSGAYPDIAVDDEDFTLAKTVIKV